MSSGAGEPSGGGGLDLNCDTVAVLDNHEAGVEDGLEDAPVSIGGELLDREGGGTMDVEGDEKKECERGIPDREDGMMGNGEGSTMSELGGRSEVCVVDTVRREAGAESHGGKILEVEFGEKGSAQLFSASSVGFEDVEASGQTMNLGDGSGGNQTGGADIDMEGMVGTDKGAFTILTGSGGTEDERLEGSSILRSEHIEVQVDLVDGGGECSDGQLDLQEREPEGESITVKLNEADTGENEITDLVTVSAERFEAVDVINQDVTLGNVSCGDHKQGIVLDAESMLIYRRLGPGERNTEVVPHSGKFLEVEKGEDGSTELAVVSAEGFEPVEASIHTEDFHDRSGGDQKQGTDLDAELDLSDKQSAELVTVSTVGFETVEASGHAMYLGDGFDDQIGVTDVNKEDMVRTNEDVAVLVHDGVAEDERLVSSPNSREVQVEVDLVDEGVQVVHDQGGPEEREAEDKFLRIKLLERDTGGTESADLVAVSAEEFETIEPSNQVVMIMGTAVSESTDLVAVSFEGFEAFEASVQAVNVGDGSGSDQKQGNDLDAEGMVIDGQLAPGETDAAVESLSGKFFEVDKGGEGNSVLVSVSIEEFRPIEAGRHPMDFHDGSGGDQKRGTDIDAEGTVIDGELVSGKREAELETPGGKLLEMDSGENEGTVLVSFSTERFEHANVCSQAMDLSDGSGYVQRLGTGLNADGMVESIEDSVAVSVGSGGKLLEVDCREKRSAGLVAVSTEVFESVKARSQATNLVRGSGDDQGLAIDLDAEGMVGINENSVTISVGSGGPEDERSQVLLVLRKEHVEVQGDLGDGRVPVVENELDTGEEEDTDFKSDGGRCKEVGIKEKGSAKLVGASPELFESVETSSEAINLGDGSGSDQKLGVNVDMKGLMGTNEVSLTALVVGGGADNEKMEGSSSLRKEQLEIQLDFVDESDLAVGTQLGCGEREAEVDSQEGMPLELLTREKESADLVATSAEEFDTIVDGNQAMNSGDGSGGDQMQGLDADAKGMDLDVQLGPGKMAVEVKSHTRKLLEVDKTEEGSAEPFAVSTEIFQPVEASSQAMDFGDRTDGDQKRGTDVNVEGVAIDGELSPEKSVAESEPHGEKFLEVGKVDEGSTELPAFSTEGGFLPCKANSEPMKLVDGCGGDQRLETDVDLQSMVTADEDSVATSIASGAPDDARFEGSLILRKEHVEVQCNLVDRINDVVEGELGPASSIAEVNSYSERFMEVDIGVKESTKLVAASTEPSEAVEAISQIMVDRINDVVEGELGPATSMAEVNSYSERFMEVDIGEKENTKLVAASTERSKAVEASSQIMEMGDESSFDQIQGTDADAECVVRNEDYVTLLVGGPPGNERLEGSLTLGNEVEVMVHLVDGCEQVESELESHGRELLEVEMEEKRKELIAAPAERFEAVEASCQAMELEEQSCSNQTQGIDVNADDKVDITDDFAAVPANNECPEDERLDEESSVLGIEHVEALCKSVDGCGQVVDGELIHGESSPIDGSHGGKLLRVETGVHGGLTSVVSAEGCEAVEACSRVMDLEHGSDGDWKQRADVYAEYMVATTGDPVNVSSTDGRLEDESLERLFLLGRKHTEVLQDLVDGHDQVLDGEFVPGEREDEIESHSEKLLELDVREKGSAELASIPAGDSTATDASSQGMNLEDRYSSEQKQESNIGAACMVKIVEDSVVVSVDGGGLEDEMFNGSSNLVKEVEVGEETHGTGTTVKDLPEATKNESADYDVTTIHVAQVQMEFNGGQRQDTDVGAKIIVGGTEQASLAVSVGGGGPEDERLETSYKFGEKQADTGEDNIRHGTPEKKLVHPEKIGGGEVDAMRETGHLEVAVQSNHVKDLDSREGSVGDHRTEPCMETDAEPLVLAVSHRGAEAQGLEVAPRSDDEQVKIKCDSDESEMVKKDEQFQKSGDSVNVDVVFDLFEGHPNEREGEIIGDNGHNLSEVNSEFPAGEENIIEKGLACLPVCVEAVHDFMDHALDDPDPGSEGYDQETVVTYGKQGISLESFQGSGLELMGGETGIVHHSTVDSEQVKALTQLSSVENNPKIYDENNTVAGETVRKLDSIPAIEEPDTDLQQEDEDRKSTVVCGGTFGCFDVAKTAMALDAAVDNMVEKGNVLLEDNGLLVSVTSAELQNVDAQLNIGHQNQKINSSSLMVSCREEAAHAAGSHSLGNFFMEKGYSIIEDSNSLLGISIPESSSELVNLTITPQWNEPSVGSLDVQHPNILSREHKEHEQGTPVLESALHALVEIDCSQKLQDGTQENLKDSDNQNGGCDSTWTESASTSQHATYYLSFPEKEGFSTSDLVWGKVKSHPWWPGQIFDFSGASQLAIKYQKKDHFLVAYFGDKTFAWCEESRLKPFQLFFSQMEKQTSSDSFLRSLRDILAEISRRVELSMTCSCLPEVVYADIKYQKVENAGVRGKLVDTVFDRREIVNYFHPDRLIEYVRELAQLPTGGADRLELTLAQAQLKSFYLSKGYTELPAFTNGSGLAENDSEIPSSMIKKLNEDDLEQTATLSDLFSTKGKLRSRDGTLGKPKQIVEDGRKQKSLSELMEEETTFLLVNKNESACEVQDDENCLSSGNKRKALDYVSTDIGRSKTMKIDFQMDEETKLSSPTSNSSFKVGAFISRAASKLTSGQPIRKCHVETSERGLYKTDDWSVDYMDLDDFLDVPFDYPKLQIDISEDYPPANEMLSKLCLAARNPLKGYNFSSNVINFFCTFRNVQVSNISIEKNKTEKPRAKRGRKKKIILDLGSPDMSTPDHMKDSYWSDMVVPEKDATSNPAKRRGRKRRKFIDESSPSLMINSPSDCEPKLLTGTMCPHVKHIMTAERPIISVEEKIVDERTPTAVILYFNSSNSLPSDMDLIRIFSRYGPLKEEETYIERKNNSAMVVFKKRTDAEMAFSSAGKFSTFGPALLSYRLRHFPFKSPLVNTMIGEDDATPIKDGDLGIMAEPEFNGDLDGKLCDAVDKESSIFVQSQENFEPVSDMPPGEFSELAQYQLGDVVVSDSAPTKTETERKEPLQDAPVQMETGACSDHLLLESLDQEFSYFDLDQAVAGDISGTEVGGEKTSGILLETLEVSHAANDRSSDEESCDPVTGVQSLKQVAETGTSGSLEEQSESGTVPEKVTQLEAVDQGFSGSASQAGSKDMPDEINIAPDQLGENECSDSPPVHVGAGTSNQSTVIDAQLMEADSCSMEVRREATTASDSTQVELGRQDPSVPVIDEAAETPHVTEVRISDQRII